MTFVTVGENRDQLTLLSRLLVSVFPGCTIHQNRDPMRAMRRLSAHKVDMIFADEDLYSGMQNMLSHRNATTQVCLLRRQEMPLPEEMTGCSILSYPITEQKMRTALQRTSQTFQGDAAI